MKKIIFMVVAMMLTFGLFAQDKKELDINDLYAALEKSGLEYDMEMVNENEKVEEGMSISKFIVHLDSIIEMNNAKTSTLWGYDCQPRTYPRYYCEAIILGTDWDGVRHRLHFSGTSTYWEYLYTAYPDDNVYNWYFNSVVGLQGCGQLYNESAIWVPAFPYGHWVIVKLIYGSEYCDNIYFLEL